MRPGEKSCINKRQHLIIKEEWRWNVRKRRVINARIITRTYWQFKIQKREITGTLASCICITFVLNYPTLCSMPASWWLETGTGKTIYTTESGNRYISGLFLSLKSRLLNITPLMKRIIHCELFLLNLPPSILTVTTEVGSFSRWKPRPHHV